MLTISPALWAAHFLASYVTAAIWCAKFTDVDGSLDNARLAIGGYTVLALAGIGVTAWIGQRRHRHAGGDPPHDADSPQDRHRFLGFATLLLSALSAVATIFQALPALFFGSCR
jgi:hypothetical protein